MAYKGSTISIKDNLITLEFQQNSDAEVFARMYFYSCLLHSFSPNKEHIWIPEKRLDVEIKGWPANVKWSRSTKKTFQGIVTNEENSFNLKEFKNVLETSMKNIVDGIVNSKLSRKLYKFEIGNNHNWQEYLFKTKGRSICALCLLYDLDPHTRDELEVNISKEYQPPLFDSNDKRVYKFYGDPSKIADELRNEGWTREGNNPTLVVKTPQRGSLNQQTYRLTTNKQDLNLQVARTNIPKRWKKELFKLHNYTCLLCHTKYENEKYLSPDHRIPVVFQADNLTASNFKDKLMTLCTYCNQRKREYTKKLPPDYDWSTSPWAYPEKFQLEKIEEEIQSYAQAHNASFRDIINKITDIHTKKLMLSNKVET